MDKKLIFQKLTPVSDAEIGIYENAMEYVFSNADIRNIAISGPYGAGKSSMLESYKKKQPEKKFIHISLAHFVPEKGSIIEKDVEEEIDEQRVITELEGKIINQLVHQIEPEKILQTNFRVKKDIDSKKVRLLTFFLTTFIAITCFLCFKSTWDNMVNGFSLEFMRKLFYFTTTKEIELLMGTVDLFILVIAIYELIILQKTTRLFKKFKLQGNEIEIFEESKDSYFDKYLNEVLYLFEHAQIDAIVFEDIDRYDTNQIFEKLREINYLLNQRCDKKIGGSEKRTIRFFYLLRDDIFLSKDRTKFFDFIIPIVPIVDASNAYDQFIKHFKQGGLLQLFDTDFLQGLSLYIDDMRVLKNIYNEFLIYYTQFETTSTEQNNNKLLAMITYKNLFPRDFVALQKGTGYVHTLFEYKEMFKKEEVKRLQKEIESLTKENEEINSELCNDLAELDAIYFSIDGKIKAGGKEESGYGSRKTFVQAILTEENVYRHHDYCDRWDKISVDAEKDAMEKNPDYIRRKALLSKKKNTVISKNNRKIQELREMLVKTEYAYLKDIISAKNDSSIFLVNYVNALDEEECFDDIKRSTYFPLIKFFIRNGFIDETYQDYMTYFYEDSITANDKIYLRSITDKKAKPYSYKLNNPELVVSRMRQIDFEEIEAYNFEVLEQILSDKKRYNAQLQQMLHNIWNNEPAEFVAGFLLREKGRITFTAEFNKYWAGACDWILSTEEFSQEIRRQYIVDTFCVSAEATIKENNSDQEIRRYIDNDPDFLALDNINVEAIKNGLQLVKAKFREINFESANKILLQYVYDNCLYCLNMELVWKFLECFYGVVETRELRNKNLSNILSKKDEPLYKYVTENIDSYLEILLANVDEIEDTEEVVAFILNCQAVSAEHKNAYLVASHTKIHRLNIITDTTLWNDVMELEKVEASETNIYDYYFLSGNGMDNRLIEYINGFEKSPILQVDKLDEVYGEDSADKLFVDIIKCNELDNEKYSSMIDSFGWVCAEFDEKEILSDKMDILISHNILEMNLDILNFIRVNYPEKCMTYIKNNIEKYVEILDEKSFSSPELMQLLDENISDETKIQLLQMERQPISIRNKCYPAVIQNYILSNLYCDADLEYIVQWYPKNSTQLRRLIMDIAEVSIRQITENSYKLHIELSEQLLQSDKIEEDDKKELLVTQIVCGMDLETVKRILRLCRLPEYQQLLEGKRPKISITKANERLLHVLKEKGWISSYEKDKKNPNYFNTYGKVVRNKNKKGRL